MELPLGWHTDLAVLRLGGSTIEDHGDHLVVRTADNPAYYWGNFVLVTDRAAVDDPDRWLETFEREFPGAHHRAIGLVGDPADDSAWTARGLTVEHDDVLATATCPSATTLPQGYLVRQLRDAIHWEQSTGLRIGEFAGESAHEAEYERGSTGQRTRMTEQGGTAWFGAFHGDRLVAELGIVDCGEGVARYQSVVTQADHRRRGLAGHLLGVAAGWAAERGARTWVIVADKDSDAARLYESRGFEPADRGTRATRKAPG
ncbi:MAG TPA: GNAT family N-acetyltransferase [Marmoricola sp.]